MVKRCIALIVLLVSIAGAKTVVCAESAPAGPVKADVPLTREAASSGETTETHLPKEQALTPWLLDPSVFKEDQGDRTEKRRVAEKEVKTIKVANVVPAIHFRTGEAEIPDDYVAMLRGVLDRMRGRLNVRLHFVGHADTQSLIGPLKAKYGDNVGLSRERAGTVAEYFKKALDLPPEAISYEGMGDGKPVATNATEAGRAQNRRVEVEVWYDEIGEKMVEKEVIVPRQVNRVKICRTETVCKMRYKEGNAHRIRVKNLVAPLHWDADTVVVPEEFQRQVRQALDNLHGKEHLAVRFIAYSDNTSLGGRDERIYGDQAGLTKAVARRVALSIHDGLKLPPEVAVESDGKGAFRPVAPNETEQGRGLNRRVEVEFWHDDALQELADEPQLCPEEAGSETVTRVYNPPSGPIAPILFQDGNPVVPDGYAERLKSLMGEVKEHANVRLRFIGYINNERLDRRNAAIYGDDIGWSTARARRTMVAVDGKLGPVVNPAEFEGHGYVQSSDVVNTGFTESAVSRVEVQIVYDEQVPLNDYEGVDITRMSREVKTANAFDLNLMRISVDGKPVDDPQKSIPDVERCTDVALDKAKIEFKYDNLRAEPRLNVTAWPRSIRYQQTPGAPIADNLVRFRIYTNYHSFLKKAEVRLFDKQQSVHTAPLAIIPVDKEGMAEWRANFPAATTPARELKYLVRVYDAQGNWDETVDQPLWVVDQVDPATAKADPAKELLAGYGATRIAQRNIPINGGTVQAYGSELPADHRVWLAGYPEPVDGKGRFIGEEILPKGSHTVEVAVLDKAGNGQLFLRDLELKKNDWFTVGIADITLSGDKTTGPASIVSVDHEPFHDINTWGRFAFYTKGQFGDGWGLTASADTGEGPFDEIFSNFLDKSPQALFRRIDPKYYFPTFGDDSTVAEDAPTSGKFYLKVQKDQSYGLWGNFRVSYTDNDLAHVDRGLYGGNLHYQTTDITSFGEKRLMVDGFAADPGTVAGRDDFRGTGGSLYYLRRQDVLQGSERLRVEVRDKDSNIVLATKDLTAVTDYNIDYLQGRVLLTQPLESTASDNLLVHSDSMGGNPVYLVVRYEFTPGVSDVNAMNYGGRAHYWFGDYVKLGVTGDLSHDLAADQTLVGGDLTVRKSAGTWLKLESARSKGSDLFTSTSSDGGYNSNTQTIPNPGSPAMAYRADGSLGLEDLSKNWRGKLTLYTQVLEAGYTAPGQTAYTRTFQLGGTADLPVTDRFSVRMKGDARNVEEGLETQDVEANGIYQLNEHWSTGLGARWDRRDDHSPIVPLTQEQGERTDVVAKVAYDSKARWNSYLFGQKTVETTGNRDDNDRIGAGGGWRLTDRFKLNGEVSEGTHGVAGKLGSEYLYSDKSTIYLTYALENERDDNGVQANKGTLTSGFRTRYSDSTSVYGEERYTHGDTPTGLIHTYGVDLTPADHLNLGTKVEFGTLQDNQSGATTRRTAAGVNAGYGFEKVKVASAVEFRDDDEEQPDTSTIERTTWLLKNSFKYQMTPDWRMVGSFDYSRSWSSQGSYYDANFTEAVVGYAYRPVYNDRLNVLVKYTFFYNVPASDQITGTNSSANYLQRSHIASIDASYDITQQWSVGGKYAYRLGQVSMDRVNPEYYDSRAHLGVARVDWHFIHQWDAMVEGRILALPDAQDRKTGALLGIYRHLGDHFKVGAGYNFSDFSDDLTNLSYRHQGMFVNAIGTL